MTTENLPSWLSAAVDQRLARLRPWIARDIGLAADVVFTPLTEPKEGSSKAEYARWDYTCDNCGSYNPNPMPFATGHVTRVLQGKQVIVSFGACPDCMAKP